MTISFMRSSFLRGAYGSATPFETDLPEPPLKAPITASRKTAMSGEDFMRPHTSSDENILARFERTLR